MSRTNKNIFLMVVWLFFSSLYAAGQNYDYRNPTSTTPGSNADRLVEIDEFVCPPTTTELGSSTASFRINAITDDVGDLDENQFIWAVYGGTITDINGDALALALEHGSGTDADIPHSYAVVKGAVSNESFITVHFGDKLPDVIWIAVQQISEYTCTDNKWSVYTIKGDNDPPTISGIPTDIPHLAWELHKNYEFTVPTLADDCADKLTFTMKINGGEAVNLIDEQGKAIQIDLLAEAPGDVDKNGTGIDNEVVFTWSDGVNESTHTWNIHVDYRPMVKLVEAIDPTCIGDDNGEIIVAFEIEVENDVIREYSTDGSIFTAFTGSLIPSLDQGDYDFRVSTLVNGYRSTSEVLRVSLTDPPLIQVSDPTTAITHETCIGASDGSVLVVVNYTDGETNPFRTTTLTWTRNGNPISLAAPTNPTNLGAALYQLTVTDAEGCFIRQTYNLVVDNLVDPTFNEEASAMTMIDPEDALANGFAAVNVNDGLCYFQVPDASFNPSAIDGACGINGLTLTHDYTGTATDPWTDATTLVGARFAVGKTTVTWTATDATGKTATRIYNVYVTDDILPSITVAANTIYPYCVPQQTIPLPAVSDNCGVQFVTCNFDPDIAGWDESYNWWPHIAASELQTSPINFDIDENYTVEWIVTDVNGRVNNKSYLLDFTVPLDFTEDYNVDDVSCYGNTNGEIVIAFDGGRPNYTVNVGTVYNQTGATTTHPIAGLAPNDYTITITDVDGCVFQKEIDVNEPTPIVIAKNSQVDNTCFEATNGELHLTVSGGNGEFAYAWSGPEAYAFADGHPWYAAPVYDFADKKNELTSLPTGSFQLTVTDKKNCTQSALYTIVSTDVHAPTYTIDYIQLRNSDLDKCTYTVQDAEFDPQTVADDCNTRVWHNVKEGDYGITNITSIHTLAGAIFPVGTYDVVWTISDLSGNKTVESVTYIINDEQDPTITCPDDVHRAANKDACSAVIPTQIDEAIVNDNCILPGGSVTFLRSDYFWADLDYPFDARPNTETITWTVTDAAGNTASCVQEVNVYDDQLPTVLVLGSELDPVPVYLLGSGEYILLPEDIDDGTYDNCSNLEALFVGNEDEPYVLSCSDIGTPIEVTLTARDNSGMEASANTWVQVFDNIPPSASTQPFTVELDQNGEGVLYPINIYGGGYSDNCTNPDDIPGFDIEDYLLLSLTNDSDPLHNPDEDTNELQLSCDELGQTTIYLVVLDEYDNRGYYPATVNVTDNGAPIIVVDWDESTEIYVRSQSPNTNDARVELDPANFGSAIDECGADFELTMDPPYVDCNDVKVDTDEPNYVTVELVATDIYGNEARENVYVRVRDNTNPVIVANTSDITLVASQPVTMQAEDFFADYHDNCGVTAFGVHVDDDGSWNPHQGANSVVTVGTRTYYDQATFSCAYEGDTKVHIYAEDASGNSITDNFDINIDSDLEITSMELDLCDIPPDDPPGRDLDGTFISTINGGTTVSDYDWSTRAGYTPFAPRDNWVCTTWFIVCLGGYYTGYNTSSDATPGYTGMNRVTYSEETVDLVITDVNGCTAEQNFIVEETSSGETNSIFRVEREACLNETVTYTQEGGNSYSWSFYDGSDEGTVTGPYDSNTFTVTWDDPAVTYAEVSVVITDGACETRVIYEVTIHDLPNPVLSVVPDNRPGNYCPLNEVRYNLQGQTYSGYDWSITSHTGTEVSGGDLYNFYGVQWDPTTSATTASVDVEVTDANGCKNTASLDISVFDDVDPTLVLPSDITTNNIPGLCEGAVILRLREGDNYSDNCSGIETVEYRKRNRNDATDWSTIAWSDWTKGSNVSGNYDVGETQVEWRVTDYSGNATTGINTITINDIDLPGFTTSPQVFVFDAGLNCDYTHDGSTNMSLTGTDNCEIIDRIWVTFDADPTKHEVNSANPDPTNGHYFDNSVTIVTWHIEDRAGNYNFHTYEVWLTDITEPDFVFVPGSEPADAGVINYEGTFAAGQRFYIFANNEAETHNLSIPANITDNCSMGDVTVTLTHNNGTQTVTGPFAVVDDADGTLDNIYTFESAFGLGQTTVRWDYNDATGNHPRSATHYIVVVSQNGFAATCPSGTVETDHECNLVPDEFTGNASPQLPTWFSWLRSNNVLTYTVTQSANLKDPDRSECLVSRDRDLTLNYSLQIQGSAITQLSASGSCTQTFEYFIDNTGPVVDLANRNDLVLECANGADHGAAITAWLNDYAGIDIVDDITDNCHTGGFFITDDYMALIGQTCGDGSKTPVTFTVTDGCGQTSTYVANIVVNDTTDPYFVDSDGDPVDMATILYDQEVNCHEIPVVPTIGVDIFAADDCVPNPTIVFTTTNTRNADGISGTCDDNTYQLVRTWTVTDACGNSIAHTQTLNVVDNHAPQWVEDVDDLAPSITVDCNTIPTAPAFTYTENCDVNPTYSFTQVNDRILDPADSRYYNYTITRTWSVQDNCNDANVHTQVITVADEAKPVIDTDATDMTVECDGAGNVTQLANWLSSHGGAVASDACVSPLHFDWDNDYDPADPNWWDVDCGNAKHKLVTFTVTDPAGNSATTSATFTIVDTQAPTWSGVLVYNQGPYELVGDIPAAYTTVAQIEAAGVAVLDACSPADAGLVVTSVDDETIGAGCSFTVERTYTITDACGNAISTLTQNFIVLDGIDPEIVKPLATQTLCAENTSNQSVLVSNLALVAADISDNCNPGQWFIDNVETGAIRYRVYHTTDNTKSIAWTIGNPNELTFYEGTSEVYFRLTDQNNNHIEKHVYTISVTHTPHLSDAITVASSGSLGASDQPFKYSTHEYVVTMENTANLSNGNAYWQIFATGDRSTPFTVGTDYTLVVSNSGNIVTAKITFDGDLLEGNYDLVFTEKHATSACPNQRAYPFTLNGPFDVDIDDEVDICPQSDFQFLTYGESGVVKTDGTGTKTKVTYAIRLNSTNYQRNWSFKYAISIGEEGTGTNDASVASVAFTSNGAGMTATTTATGTVNVSYNAGSPTTVITLDVEYNDIHGTSQLVEVALTDITGSFGEVDENTQLNTADDATVGEDTNHDQNNVRHLIKNLPLSGNIGGIE